MGVKNYPKISVIIPAKPGIKIGRAVNFLSKVDYPEKFVEVFVAYGFNPSRQRNEAVKKTKGEILYFLDSDSEVKKDAFKKSVLVFSGRIASFRILQARGFSFFPQWLNRLIIQKFFSGIIYKGKIGVVGGPNVWWRQESFWASLSGIILESFFSHLQMAARYRPIGEIHRASEKELILCNLAVRRDVFQEVGGFNEILYPNEENELLNRIEKAGYQLIYHPGVLVFRPRRETFKDLLIAFFHYGRGRMEQVRIEGVWQNLLFLLPLIFLIYLLGLLFFHSYFFLLPLIFYFGMAFVSALGFAARRRKPYLVVFLPPFFLIVHLTYAFGLIRGLFTDFEKRRKKEKEKRIKVVKIKSFGKSWNFIA